MKDFFKTSLVVLVLVWGAGPLRAQELDFSEIEWGMSVNDVIALKGSGIIDKGDDYLAYWERYLGKRFKVVYFFEDGGLVQFELRFEDKMKEGEGYLDFMFLLRDAFSDLYGVVDDYKTVISMDNIDPENLEKGVREGKIRYQFWWYKESFTAELRMGKILETPPPLALVIFSADRWET